YLIRGSSIHYDIKLIYCGGGPITVACHWGSRASPRRCTIAQAWRTLTKPHV
ncbi:unnamed protein product, partial [Musa acuminata subsp. malaccensis]